MTALSPLTPTERIAQKTIWILLFLGMLILMVGFYNHQYHISRQSFLYPVLLLIGETCCLIYAINAFTSSNIIRNNLLRGSRVSIWCWLLKIINRKPFVENPNWLSFSIKLQGSIAAGLAVFLLTKAFTLLTT